jgi:prepilin-type N-terminal cleavage/methylation domain-containing protein
MKMFRPKAAFTLVELVVVISILALLSGVLVPRVSDHMRASRDSQRLADVKILRNAIEQYYMDKGRYPQARANSKYGGWDVSQDGDFIRDLRNFGYLDSDVFDPINDTTYHYRYFVFDRAAFGCKGEGKYYVLGVKKFESPEFAARNKGFFKCADRDWGQEFDYVTGGGTTFPE